MTERRLVFEPRQGRHKPAGSTGRQLAHARCRPYRGWRRSRAFSPPTACAVGQKTSPLTRLQATRNRLWRLPRPRRAKGRPVECLHRAEVFSACPPWQTGPRVWTFAGGARLGVRQRSCRLHLAGRALLLKRRKPFPGGRAALGCYLSGTLMRHCNGGNAG
jgi:hypothetical protein